MNADDKIRASLSARYLLFTLFRSLFGQQPSEEQMRSIDPDLIAEAFYAADAPNGAPIARALEVAKKTPEDERARVYMRTLVGPGKLPCAPWESVHVSGEPTLFQASTMDVRNSYREQGLIPELYPRVADDHIALECAFLAELAGRALECYSSEDVQGAREALEASERFQSNHLGRWVGDYARGLRDNGACSPYGEYAQALVALVEAPVPIVQV